MNPKKRLPVQFVEGFKVQGGAPVQEDHFEMNPERGFFILADGFGGGAGSEASKTAVEAVKRFLEQEAGDLDATLPFELRPYLSLSGNILINAVAYANECVMKLNQGSDWLNSGGASLLVGYLEGRLFTFAQVGVCRAYLKREATEIPIVHAKSLQAQVDPLREEGLLDGIPLMSLGTHRSVDPEIREIEVRPGDQVLMHTSGFKGSSRANFLKLNESSEIRQWIDLMQTDRNASGIWIAF